MMRGFDHETDPAMMDEGCLLQGRTTAILRDPLQYDEKYLVLNCGKHGLSMCQFFTPAIALDMATDWVLLDLKSSEQQDEAA